MFPAGVKQLERLARCWPGTRWPSGSPSGGPLLHIPNYTEDLVQLLGLQGIACRFRMGSAKLAQVYCTGIPRHRMTSTLLTAKDPSVTALLGLLRDGLPRAAEGSGRSIVVVGAGIAGLVAGWLLHRAGHRVTLLEARTRMGGASSPIAVRPLGCSRNSAPCAFRASIPWANT
jgi:hypothetical protein